MADLHQFENDRKTGMNFSHPRDATLYLLRCFAQKFKTARINFSFFISFVKKALLKFNEQAGGIQSLRTDTETTIAVQLKNLSHEKKCSLEYLDEKISFIISPATLLIFYIKYTKR